jgi:hypothetical protein
MDACRRVMTVLIVLVWAIGGIPASSCDSAGEHTGGENGGHVLVCRRPQAATVLPDADADDEADAPPRVSGAAGAVVSDAPSASATIVGLVVNARLARLIRRPPPLASGCRARPAPAGASRWASRRISTRDRVGEG